MKKYIQADINVTTQIEKDILIAELSDIGFEGFEEERLLVKAFITSTDFNEAAFQRLMKKKGLQFSTNRLDDKNWNAIWEAGFEPVTVGNFCTIRADFHLPAERTKHEIIITPKMSFGTGHHATTFLMIAAMKEINFHGKKVYDFGTGTGVLAILAEQLGAASVMAIDNDDWSIENAKENLIRNHSIKIHIIKDEKISGAGVYDIILANINKHVIMQQMGSIREALKVNGLILFSGLLSEDEPEINQLAKVHGLQLINKTEKHNWICLNYVSSS